jgi:phosphatidylglycerophosphate synthase
VAQSRGTYAGEPCVLDATIRRHIDPPLDAAGRWLAGRGIGADAVTVIGFLLGAAGAAAIALGNVTVGLVLILANRLADGLDGAVARATRRTDRGGFLDIVLDFAFYAAVPLGFAALDPARNALAAAVLLASFLANGAAFFAFALMAERRGLATRAQGAKSLYYLAGLAEGTETIIAFVAFCLFPSAFPLLACAFAALCAVSATARVALAWRMLT